MHGASQQCMNHHTYAHTMKATWAKENEATIRKGGITGSTIDREYPEKCSRFFCKPEKALNSLSKVGNTLFRCVTEPQD